tara:strand:- start:2555 stop:3442 length:888 start_codon:yes stop_codon:yes gene_type:complete
MKIYDACIYYDEDILLDLRFNILDRYIDKFIVVESLFTHSGEKKRQNFKIENFSKFKHKIEYILLKENPKNIYEIKENDKKKLNKTIDNANAREIYQRNAIEKGLNQIHENDWVIISDVDEIPNLENLNLDKVNNKIILFNQIFCCYKFNLFSKTINWYGSRMIKKKHLKSPQWLRDIKSKRYSIFRADILFSNKKYRDIFFVDNGGWHFSYLKDAKGVEDKLKSIRHHVDFELNPVSTEKLENMIKDKKLVYNYNLDQRAENKFSDNEILENLDFNKLPKFLIENQKKYSKWLN